MHQTCTGTKKTKKTKISRNYGVHFWVVAGIFVFFGFFGACRCLVHLVVWWFFGFFGACQCFVKSESPNLHRHQKNQKNQTTRCTKPSQAPKKPKKLKFPGTMGPLLSSCWNFCFFWFFWCLSMFGASSGLFFFFWWLSMFLYISCQDHDEKSVFY